MLVALWFLAGAGAVTLASAGVGVVSDQLTDGSRPAPLSAEQVRQRLAAQTPTTTAVTSTTSTPAGPSTTAAIGVGGTTTTVAPPASTPSTPTTAAPTPSSTKTYDLVGGTVTLRFSAQGVVVLVATPAPGFSVDVSDAHSGGVRVEFESDDHRSRVDGWWDGGPRDEVREEGDGGGSGDD